MGTEARALEAQLDALRATSDECRQALTRIDTERSWFRTLIDQAAEGILIADLQGRYVDANPVACRYLGYTREELLSLRILDTLAPGERPRLAAAREALLTSEDHAQVGEWTLRRKDGAPLPVEISAKILTDGHWLGFVRDISERKRQEGEQRLLAAAGLHLGASLHPTETIQRVARCAVPLLADLCLVCLLDEQRWCYALDVAATSSSGERRLLEALTRCSRDVEAHNPLVAAALRTGEAVIADLQAAPPGADEWWQALSQVLPISSLMTVPLRARGHFLGVMQLAQSGRPRPYDRRDQGTAAELGHRAALAIDNAYLYQTAREAAQRRDEVMRVVAHDLRNPLSTISLSAQMLLKVQERGDALPRECLERILHAVTRGDRIIQDLLDVARMEAGGLSLRKRPEALAAIIKSAIDMHRPLAEQKSLQLEVALEEALPAIAADRDRLLQVLSNLLGNAIKFTPPDGRIVLRAQRTSAGAQVTVSDTGPGIQPQDIPRVFDLFWQATRGARDGAGLGLGIARGLVAAHGGRLWVESVPGHGASFHFTLPALAETDADQP